MLYSEFQTTISSLLALQDAAGQAILAPLWPRIVEAAELYMYRDPDLDFLATRIATAQPVMAGQRAQPIPGEYIVIEGVNLITPAGLNSTTGAPLPTGAQRIPLLRTSRDFLDAVWPSESMTAAPQPFQTYFALYSMQAIPAWLPPNVQWSEISQVLIAPTPDQAYTIEIYGTQRPQSLFSSNPVNTSFLSIFLPDLLISAAMIWCTGAIKLNFGAQSDNPQQALSWVQLYEQQKRSTTVEVARQHAWSAATTALPPIPVTGAARPAA